MVRSSRYASCSSVLMAVPKDSQGVSILVGDELPVDQPTYGVRYVANAGSQGDVVRI